MRIEELERRKPGLAAHPARVVTGAAPAPLAHRERDAVRPRELEPGRLRRRALQVLGLLGVLVVVALLAPGLDDVRALLDGASPGWLVAAVVLEGLSCASYVLLFRGVFGDRLSWRASWRVGLSELAVGSIVPASGIGGLVLGAWMFSRSMAAAEIARRSVAFFLLKSSVNFAAVALIGGLMSVGLVGPDHSLALTLGPAAAAALVIAAVVAIPRLGRGGAAAAGAPWSRRAAAAARRAAIGGAAEAAAIVRSRNVAVLAGTVGYWAFDNAVLWASFQAVGETPPLSIVLMGYLIGQLGGLLPVPGGVGGIDGGLVGVLIVYGAPAAATVAAVLAYRLILFWLPLLVGGMALSRSVALRRPGVAGGTSRSPDGGAALESAT